MAVDAVSAALAAIGFVAMVVGISLMYYSVEDEERNDGWFFHDAERTDENISRYNAGRILSIAGVVVMLGGIAFGAIRDNDD